MAHFVAVGKIGQDFEQESELEIDKDVEEQLKSDYQLAQKKKIHQQNARQIQQLAEAEEMRRIQYEIHDMNNKIPVG